MCQRSKHFTIADYFLYFPNKCQQALITTIPAQVLTNTPLLRVWHQLILVRLHCLEIGQRPLRPLQPTGLCTQLLLPWAGLNQAECYLVQYRNKEGN